MDLIVLAAVGGGARVFDLVPPLALLLLSLGLASTLGRRVFALPRRELAVVCLLGPTLYAVGMLLYLLGGKWKPGVGVGAIGTLAIPATIAWTLTRGRARWIAPALAALTWALAWLLTIPAIRPEAFGPGAPRICYAVFTAVALLLSGMGLRTAPEASGLDRRILALSFPFLLIASLYMSTWGIVVPEKPVFSTSIHVCAEILLLMLIGQGGERERGDPNGLANLALQALLLGMGAVLLLVLASNLRLFPRSASAVLVASVIAVGLSLAYGTLRPVLDRVLLDALYPEARDAARRADELEGELEHARDRLREAEQLSVVGQLAAQVAHEIKNPLGPIKGYTKIIEREVLKAGALSETVQRGIEIIRQEVETIDARARALLELAKPPQPVLTEVELLDLIDTTVERVRVGQASAGRPLRWTWGARPQAPAPARVDGPLLRSALVNVLQNAAQALSESESDEVRLQLERDESGAGWVLSVEEQGRGLPEDLGELFRPFVSHREGGTGLGLVIARGSLRAMGGDLELVPNQPRGARARLQIPGAAGGASRGPSEAVSTRTVARLADGSAREGTVGEAGATGAVDSAGAGAGCATDAADASVSDSSDGSA